jgi:hypothetical protein
MLLLAARRAVLFLRLHFRKWDELTQSDSREETDADAPGKTHAE